MKNLYLVKLALMGITSGLILSNASTYSETTAPNQSAPRQGCGGKNGCGNGDEDDNGNIGYFVLSEEELLLELNAQGEALYKSLSEEGKALARKVASQRCNGTNTCKGLNACQTETNDCAGKGACKNQSKCAISDKNLAVKLAAEKMKKMKEQQEQNPSD